MAPPNARLPPCLPVPQAPLVQSQLNFMNHFITHIVVSLSLSLPLYQTCFNRLYKYTRTTTHTSIRSSMFACTYSWHEHMHGFMDAWMHSSTHTHTSHMPHNMLRTCKMRPTCPDMTRHAMTPSHVQDRGPLSVLGYAPSSHQSVHPRIYP